MAALRPMQGPDSDCEAARVSTSVEPDSDLALPSPPAALARVIEAASDPDVNVADLGRLVSSDPVLAAQLLRTVNSVFFFRAVWAEWVLGRRFATYEKGH